MYLYTLTFQNIRYTVYNKFSSFVCVKLDIHNFRVHCGFCFGVGRELIEGRVLSDAVWLVQLVTYRPRNLGDQRSLPVKGRIVRLSTGWLIP